MPSTIRRIRIALKVLQSRVALVALVLKAIALVNGLFEPESGHPCRIARGDAAFYQCLLAVPKAERWGLPALRANKRGSGKACDGRDRAFQKWQHPRGIPPGNASETAALPMAAKAG